MAGRKIIWYEDADEFWKNSIANMEQTEVVLDVGCGIVPMNFFRPLFHIMLEPFSEYRDILVHRNAGDKSVFILGGTAQEMLPHFADNSVDTVFLLDLIEHLPKEDGYVLLKEAERIARKQVVVFTPLGFMPQHMDQGETDGWGLGGAAFQEHLSGWLPEDFGVEWDFHICETFHKYDFRQQLLEEPYGAMYAIRSFAEKPVAQPGKLVDFRKPLPSEIDLEEERLAHQQTGAMLQAEKSRGEQVWNELLKTKGELAQAQNELLQTAGALALAQVELANAQRILAHPVIRAQRRIWRLMRFWK